MNQNQFAHIIELIKQSRTAAIKTVNTELINLYWNIGAYISNRLISSAWGEKTVDELANFIQKNYPELKGFNRRGLYRMKQFYETYTSKVFVSPAKPQIQIPENQNAEIVTPVVTRLEISDIRQSILAKISWSHHLVIIVRAKTDEEKEFYIRLCEKERYSKRELERQIDSGIFERVMIGNQKLSPALREKHPDIFNNFKDSYVFEFLNLSDIL
jgi:predicted nuclease of restriction endonuclease-like (RecB) superfamily